MMMMIYSKWHLEECLSGCMVRRHGNVLFQCQPNAGNRNNGSHNNDMLTRWLIRCRLDELSLGNVCVCVYVTGKNKDKYAEEEEEEEERKKDWTSEDDADKNM